MAKIISKYCKAPLKAIYTSEGTVEHICSKCGQPTDAYIEPETIKDQWGNYIKAPLPPIGNTTNYLDSRTPQEKAEEPEGITTKTEDWKEEFENLWEASFDREGNENTFENEYEKRKRKKNDERLKDFIFDQIQEAEKRGAKKERERWLRMLTEEK